MSRQKVILITGANGEVGHGLIEKLSQQTPRPRIVTLDIRNIAPAMQPLVERHIVGDILDTILLSTLINEYDIEAIYHLAALLSTHSEFNPEAAHRVNVQGTINLLHLAAEEGRLRGKPVRFLYPSSIAAYGVPTLEAKAAAHPATETDFPYPTTMYGCNKLYCEHLGRYYTFHYQQLSAAPSVGVDFRCVRFPGLISATTVPSGGTSDYGPEMLHAAAQGKPYACFVREDTTIPFMAMPDAVKSLLLLAEAPAEKLTQRVYNVTSFSLSAGDFAQRVKQAFPDAHISFKPDKARQGIVDTWPADIDDSAARKDWGWSPDYDIERAFNEYLIPTIRQRYQNA